MPRWVRHSSRPGAPGAIERLSTVHRGTEYIGYNRPCCAPNSADAEGHKTKRAFSIGFRAARLDPSVHGMNFLALVLVSPAISDSLTRVDSWPGPGKPSPTCHGLNFEQCHLVPGCTWNEVLMQPPAPLATIVAPYG